MADDKKQAAFFKWVLPDHVVWARIRRRIMLWHDASRVMFGKERDGRCLRVAVASISRRCDKVLLNHTRVIVACNGASGSSG